MSLKLTTAPTSEPLTTSEVKSFLRIDNSDEDAMVSSIISSARQMAEEYTLRAFISQTWDLWFDRWPNGRSNVLWDGTIQGHANILSTMQRFITIPRPPLISVSYLKTYGEDDSATTFSASNYIVDSNSTPGRIILKTSQTWPLSLRAGSAINIQFVAGYGTTSSGVPAQIKQAILVIAANLFEKRGDEESATIPDLAKKLLNPYRVYNIGDFNQLPAGYR